MNPPLITSLSDGSPGLVAKGGGSSSRDLVWLEEPDTVAQIFAVNFVFIDWKRPKIIEKRPWLFGSYKDQWQDMSLQDTLFHSD